MLTNTRSVPRMLPERESACGTLCPSLEAKPDASGGDADGEMRINGPPSASQRGSKRDSDRRTWSHELWELARGHRAKIAGTYLLFNVENVVRLAQPLLLGWAINGLIQGTSRGLIWFACGHLIHLLLRSARQMLDTRTFTSIYSDAATDLVLRQRKTGIDVSRVSARSNLFREFVEFLEHQVPRMMRSAYSVIGALVMLAFYDGMLIVYCSGMLIPAGVLYWFYGGQTLRLSRKLHNELEREVGMVDRGSRAQLHDHYQHVARARIQLSDWEALTTGLMELFVLALMVCGLLRYCTMAGAGPGDIFAVFRYVLLFVMGLDNLPVLVSQISRLRDIGQRL